MLVLTPSPSECTMYSWARTQAAGYMAWVHDRRVSTLRTPSGYVLRSDELKHTLHQPTLGLSHIIL